MSGNIDDPVFMPLFAFACRFCFQRKLRIWALSRRHVAITLSPLQKTSKSANAFKVLSLWLIKQVLKSAMHAKMFLGGFSSSVMKQFLKVQTLLPF